MFYLNKYQEYFLVMQENKIQNVKPHVDKFCGCQEMFLLGLLI